MRRPPDVESSCECVEQEAENGWTSLALELGCLLPFTVKAITRVYPNVSGLSR